MVITTSSRIRCQLQKVTIATASKLGTGYIVRIDTQRAVVLLLSTSGYSARIIRKPTQASRGPTPRVMTKQLSAALAFAPRVLLRTRLEENSRRKEPRLEPSQAEGWAQNIGGGSSPHKRSAPLAPSHRPRRRPVQDGRPALRCRALPRRRRRRPLPTPPTLPQISPRHRASNGRPRPASVPAA